MLIIFCLQSKDTFTICNVLYMDDKIKFLKNYHLVSGQFLVPRESPGRAGNVGGLGVAEVRVVPRGFVQPQSSPRQFISVVA